MKGKSVLLFPNISAFPHARIQRGGTSRNRKQLSQPKVPTISAAELRAVPVQTKSGPRG